ncbi:MAG: hypothetical protein ABIG84_05900 [archaeon]
MDVNRLFGYSMAVLLVMLFVAPTALALEVRGGDKFVLLKGEVIDDDLIVMASDITIDGRIKGDLIAAGGNIFVNGDVEGDVIIAGGSVDIKGRVMDDAILASGSIDITGDVSDNLMSASGSFKMGDEGSVGRDAFLATGAADVMGHIGRNLDVRASNVVIGGNIAGNVSIDTGDNQAAPRIMPTARVGGDVNYVSLNDIVIDEGSSVSGSVNKTLPPATRVKTDFQRFNDSVAGFLSIFIVGFILVRLFPIHTRTVCNTLRGSALSSGLWGIVGLIVVPFFAILLMISIIGLPLALISLVLYLVMIYVSKIYVSVFFGKYLLRMGGSKSDSLVLMLALGLLVFELVGLVPGVGGFVALLVVVFGFGAILLAGKEMYVNFRKKKLI